MDLSNNQIKIALIDIARKKNRPEFGLSVIRDVTDAIKNNLPHDLKKEVLEQINNNISQSPVQVQSELSRLKDACKTEEDKNFLAVKLGITSPVLNQILRGRHIISPLLWKRIEPLLIEMPSYKKMQRNSISKNSDDPNQQALWR